MNPLLATLICACGIAGLFYLDRDKTIRTSKALWLPTIWMGLTGSRPVTAWLGITPTGGNIQLEGSPVDAAVFAVLSATAILVLIRRDKRTRTLLAENWPILIYFLYCLISVTWSYHPDVAFKRWIKSIGDLAMVLVIVTEQQPIAALRRLISRIGFVSLPASVLFIKYFPLLGRGYTADGTPMNTGVTPDKNMLGVLVFVISLATLSQVLTLLRDKRRPGRPRHLLAQGTLLVFAILLLRMADSATAIACFVLGGGLFLAMNLRAIRGRTVRVHALCLALLLAGGVTFLFTGHVDVAHALGRQATLTGRTDIWAAVIPTVPNSIVGAGFESYWISPSAEKLWRSLSREGWDDPKTLINEAHNGYIEVYLNLGLVGVSLISAILISGYLRAVKAFELNPSIASLMLAYIIASAAYSITEAGFRMLDLMWIFLLLAIVSSSGVIAGFFRGKPHKIPPSRSGTTNAILAGKGLTPVGSGAYAAR